MPQKGCSKSSRYDRKIADSFEVVGIHNCAWSATSYFDHYTKIPRVAYLDMGIESDLRKSKSLFPKTRRAIYTPKDLASKPVREIRTDLEHIARE